MKKRRNHKKILLIVAGGAAIGLAIWWLYRRAQAPALTANAPVALPPPASTPSPATVVSGLTTEPEGGRDIDGYSLEVETGG